MAIRAEPAQREEGIWQGKNHFRRDEECGHSRFRRRSWRLGPQDEYKSHRYPYEPFEDIWCEWQDGACVWKRNRLGDGMRQIFSGQQWR